MTRKDYIVIAKALASANPGGDTDITRQWQFDCARIAAALSAENSRFNHDTFIAACKAE